MAVYTPLDKSQIGYVDPNQPEKGRTARWDPATGMWKSDKGFLIRDDAIRASPGPASPSSPAPPATKPPEQAALAGLQTASTGAAGPGLAEDAGSTMLNAPNALRQGIGTRTPPLLDMVLASLKRIY